jgi:CheY-like chemotaxis protein
MRIVLCDPDPVARREMGGALATAGYLVTSAATGLEALVAVDRTRDKPGLIVCEVDVPELDGFSLVRALRGNPATRHIAVMFVAFRADLFTVAQAMSLNARYFVAKPFVVTDVVRKARELVTSPG